MLPTHAGLQLAETDQCTLYESPLSLSFFLDVCKLCLICCMTFQQFSYYIYKMKITVNVKLMRKIEFEMCYNVILGTQSSDGFSLCMCDSVSTLPDVVA